MNGLLVRLRLPLLGLAVLVLQQAVLSGLRVHYAQPDVMLLLAIAVGLVGGPQTGAWVGFVIGVVADLFVTTPFGLSAFSYGLVGMLVGLLHSSEGRSTLWFPVAVAMAASVVAELAFVTAAATVGHRQYVHDHLVWVIAVVAIVNGALAGPAVRAASWALPDRARPAAL